MYLRWSLCTLYLPACQVELPSVIQVSVVVALVCWALLTSLGLFIPDTVPNPAMPMSDPGSLFLNLIKHTDARPLLQNIVMNVNYNNMGKASDGDKHAETWH